MSVTLNMIIDELVDLGYSLSLRGTGFVRQFNAICLLDGRGSNREDCLYVCGLDELHAVSASDRPGSLLCFCRSDDDSYIDDDGNSGIVVYVRGASSQGALFNDVSAYAARIDEWMLAMQRFALEGKSIQHLIDASIPIVRNHIAVSDSSLKLVCSSKGNVPEDDPVTVALLSNGFHTNDVIARFRRAHRLDEWEHNMGQLVVNATRELTPYDVVSRIFKYNHRSFMYVAMTCNVKPLTDGLLDCFQRMVDVLSFSVEREWSACDAATKPFASLFCDLLDERCVDENVACKRMKTLGLSFEANWLVAVISDVYPEKYSIGRFVRELERAVNEEKIVYRNNEIIIWKTLLGEKGRAVAEFYESATRLVDAYETRCGISSPFCDPLNVPLAYRQARVCLTSAARNHQALCSALDETAKPQGGVVAFDSNLDLCMLSGLCQDASLYEASECGTLLKSFVRENGGCLDDVRLLLTYLMCERNAAETGRRLFMHRNNVLYRIGKIRDRLGLDFDDPPIRFCLVNLCYLMLNPLN